MDSARFQSLVAAARADIGGGPGEAVHDYLWTAERVLKALHTLIEGRAQAPDASS
ncbi:MAG: hypothetical protein ACKVPX_16345 [Myxococcaceae bacterium]